MEVSISRQLMLLFGSAALGFSLGAVYDIFRIIRLAVKSPSSVIFVQDILYFFISAAATFFYILVFNSGEVRGFIIISELLGFFVYYLTVGYVVIRISGVIIRILKCILSRIVAIVMWPFRTIFRIMTGLLKKISEILIKIIKKSAIKFKKLLKPCINVLYNLINNIKVGFCNLLKVKKRSDKRAEKLS